VDTLTINGKSYGYAFNFRNDTELRASFNRLTQKVYGFDFENWYLSGYWDAKYIPYSLLSDNAIVSNICVSVMEFLVKGTKRNFVQIGTVMTDPEYRNQGLNRVLLERVLADWRGKCDLIYLFANDSVLDFYPKFGFSRADEYQYSRKVDFVNNQFAVVKLNMLEKENREFLLNKIERSLSISPLSMVNSSSLVMFHCTAPWASNNYYIKELDAIAVADISDDVLFLKGVFCEKELVLDELINALSNKQIKKVVLGFTPNDKTSFNKSILVPDDVLFVLDDNYSLFDTENYQFPALSHA